MSCCMGTEVEIFRGDPSRERVLASDKNESKRLTSNRPKLTKHVFYTHLTARSSREPAYIIRSSTVPYEHGATPISGRCMLAILLKFLPAKASRAADRRRAACSSARLCNRCAQMMFGSRDVGSRDVHTYTRL